MKWICDPKQLIHGNSSMDEELCRIIMNKFTQAYSKTGVEAKAATLVEKCKMALKTKAFNVIVKSFIMNFYYYILRFFECQDTLRNIKSFNVR